ncbi:ABC transporter ATP-binding protein [Longispora fulva]|uniref:ABC-type multidrug transport system ATPase subunit n=1 Tax=Longispora fulva TaxID=619741 RepID=A0A8J7KVG8_9ACTN|nr:ATP-binding cassette domain-containing protein [Longispora fulva]MBG6135287.1 ABC-type multidrug transport system ATPase subunit [Longispora fulva]GIG56474.1 ABC transporter ATP-binding protein [Longispora fulva]
MLLDDVRVRYARSGPWILDRVSVAAHPGEAVVVLGRNGAGKSTLLNVCAGVLRPDTGRVTDRPAVVGWVPERFPAAQPFTAREYLAGAGRIRGLTAAGADRAVAHWAERLHLGPFLDVRLGRLSKGSAQKVGLAQALLVPPELLVLDEPWEGLDAVARAEVPLIVGEVTAGGGIVLVSDHRGEIARLAVAQRWTVRDGGVHPDGDDPSRCVIEIEVPAADAAGTVTALRAQGHEVLGVRPR